MALIQEDFKKIKRLDFSKDFSNIKEFKSSMNKRINMLYYKLGLKDMYTIEHQKDVAEIAAKIACKMNLKKKEISDIKVAALLHDLGKAKIPASILNKKEKLLPAEYRLIQQHPRMSYDILKKSNIDDGIAEIVLKHHERLNGSGYPLGLKGSELGLKVRIIALADVLEAMLSPRPYKEALKTNEVLCEIEKNKGILYDTNAVDTVIKYKNEILREA